MTGFWPDPADPKWAGLDAVARVTNDPRDIEPPCFLLSPQSIQLVGSCAVSFVLQVIAVAPGPTHGDALAWLWDEAAPAMVNILDLVELDVYNGYPALTGSTTIERDSK